ncbi:hypothetical protein CDIK_0145 [Cucumispora dikerogammari]|nr:hypothetical protein CDIK_0145 [Cucumispora dikerogammari]
MHVKSMRSFLIIYILITTKSCLSSTRYIDNESTFSSGAASMQLSDFMKKSHSSKVSTIDDRNHHNDRQLIKHKHTGNNQIVRTSLMGSSNNTVQQNGANNINRVICDPLLGQILVINVSGLEECQFVSSQTMHINQIKQQPVPVCFGVECSIVAKPQPMSMLVNRVAPPPQPVSVSLGRYVNMEPLSHNLIVKPELTSSVIISTETPEFNIGTAIFHQSVSEPEEIVTKTVVVKEEPEIRIFKELISSPPVTVTESISVPRKTIRLQEPPQTKTVVETVSATPVTSTIINTIELPPETVRIYEPRTTETVVEYFESPPKTEVVYSEVELPPITETIKETVKETVKETIVNTVNMPQRTVQVEGPITTKYINQIIPAPPVTSIVTQKIVEPSDIITSIVTKNITQTIQEPSETVTVKDIKTIGIVFNDNANKQRTANKKTDISKTVSLNASVDHSNLSNSAESIEKAKQYYVNKPTPLLISTDKVKTIYNSASVNSNTISGNCTGYYNTLKTTNNNQKTVYSMPTQQVITRRITPVEYNICDSICERNKTRKPIILTRMICSNDCSTTQDSNSRNTKTVRLLRNSITQNNTRNNQPSQKITNIIIKTPHLPLQESKISTSALIQSNNVVNSNNLVSRNFSKINNQSGTNTIFYNTECDSSSSHSNYFHPSAYKSNGRSFIETNYSELNQINKQKTIKDLKSKLDSIYNEFIKNQKTDQQNNDPGFVNFLFDSIYDKNQNLTSSRNKRTERFKKEIQNMIKNKQYEAKLNRNKIINNHLQTLINTSPVLNKQTTRTVQYPFEESSFISGRISHSCDGDSSSSVDTRRKIPRLNNIENIRKTQRIIKLREHLKRKLLFKRKLKENLLFQRIKNRNLLSRLVGPKIIKIKRVLKNMANEEQMNLLDILLNSCNNFCDFDLDTICRKFSRKMNFCTSMNSSDDVVIFLSELVHN